MAPRITASSKRRSRHPGREHWREIEPHRPGRLILEIVAYQEPSRAARARGWAARASSFAASPTARSTQIAFAEEAYALGISPGYEYDTTTLRFTYSSMTTPAQVFDYDMETRERTLRKTQEDPERSRSFAITSRAASWRRRRTARPFRSRCSIARRRRSTARAAPALRLWRLRHDDPGRLLHQRA